MAKKHIVCLKETQLCRVFIHVTTNPLENFHVDKRIWMNLGGTHVEVLKHILPKVGKKQPKSHIYEDNLVYENRDQRVL